MVSSKQKMISPTLPKNKVMIKGQKGFSLIEILVALFLITIVITSFTVSDGAFSSRSKLDQTFDNIERAARFAKDEASLRNSIVRILFKLDQDPQTFTIQFSTKKDFLLTDKILDIGRKNLGLKEKEEEESEIKKLSKSFSNVDEFADEPFELPINDKIIAIGSALTKNLSQDSEVSIFVYPTGERDDSVVYFMTDMEMASLSLPKFTNTFERNYTQLETDLPLEEAEEEYLKRAQDHFDKWLVN